MNSTPTVTLSLSESKSHTLVTPTVVLKANQTLTLTATLVEAFGDDEADYLPLAMGIMTLVLICLCAAFLLKNVLSPASSKGPSVPSSVHDYEHHITEGSTHYGTTFGGSSGRPALIILSGNSYGETRAFDLVGKLGCTEIRSYGPHQRAFGSATKDNIMQGFKWLCDTCTGVVDPVIVVSAHPENDGFQPSDFTSAGSISSSEMAGALSQLTGRSLTIFYDVPQPNISTGTTTLTLPYYQSPGGHAAVGYTTSAIRIHTMLITLHGRSTPGDVIANAHSAPKGSMRDFLDWIASKSDHECTPAVWSNRVISDSEPFPVWGEREITGPNPESSPLRSSHPSQPAGIAMVKSPVHAPSFKNSTGFSSMRPAPLSTGQHSSTKPESLWYRKMSGGGPGSDVGSGDEGGWIPLQVHNSGRVLPGDSSYDPPRPRSRLASQMHPTSGLASIGFPRETGSPLQHTASGRVRVDDMFSSPPPPVRSPQSIHSLRPGSPIAPSPPLFSSPYSGFQSHSPVRTGSPLRNSRSPVRNTFSSRSPRRSVSPAAANLSDALYSPTHSPSGQAPGPTPCLLQSHLGIPSYTYKRCTARATLTHEWHIHISIEHEDSITIPVEEIERCGAEESGSTDYPEQSVFIVVTGTPRYVLAFETTADRNKWLSWIHTTRPESVIILPSSFQLPEL